jgi:hypothetical protein
MSARAADTSGESYPEVRRFGNSPPTVVFVRKPATTVAVLAHGAALKAEPTSAARYQLQRQSDPHGGLRVLYVRADSAQ